MSTMERKGKIGGTLRDRRYEITRGRVHAGSPASEKMEGRCPQRPRKGTNFHGTQ